MNSYPKPTRWVSKKYESWVRSLLCANCEASHSEVHHAKGIGHLSGVGSKAGSQYSMPLCYHCHGIVHGKLGTPEQHKMFIERQWEWIAKTLGMAIEEGVLKSNS